MTVTDQMAKVV